MCLICVQCSLTFFTSVYADSASPRAFSDAGHVGPRLSRPCAPIEKSMRIFVRTQCSTQYTFKILTPPTLDRQTSMSAQDNACAASRARRGNRTAGDRRRAEQSGRLQPWRSKSGPRTREVVARETHPSLGSGLAVQKGRERERRIQRFFGGMCSYVISCLTEMGRSLSSKHLKSLTSNLCRFDQVKDLEMGLHLVEYLGSKLMVHLHQLGPFPSQHDRQKCWLVVLGEMFHNVPCLIYLC